MIYGTGST